MKNKLFLLILVFAMVGMSGCYKMIEPGYEAMEVYVAGSKTGEQSLKPAGRYWNTYRVKHYEFPIFEQTAQFRGEESFEFTVEGLSVGMEIGLSYIITDVEQVFRRYRVGVDEITDVHLRNIVRDALNVETRSMDMEGIYGESANDMMGRVFESVNKTVSGIGIEITGVYMIGRPQFPREVEQAIENRIKANQLAEQREIERREAIAQAEIDREQARGRADAQVIDAQGTAESNRLVNESLTELLVQYKALDVWDGKTPQTMAGGAVPFLNLDN